MDFVHDDVFESTQGVRPGVEHVAQDLGGHDGDAGLGVDDLVPGQQPDPLRTVDGCQVAVLLVGQRLDRRGVEALITSFERQETSEFTNDGFAISEEDLRLRGPGDFFGNRQHGLPELKIADLCTDTGILKDAHSAAERDTGMVCSRENMSFPVSVCSSFMTPKKFGLKRTSRKQS